MASTATPAVQKVTESKTLPPLWGIKFNGEWWLKDDGTVYYVPHERIALIQAELLARRSPEGVTFKVERIQ